MNKLSIGEDLYLKGRIGWQGLSKEEYLETSDYKIINATSLMDGYVDWNNCGYITKERYDEAKEIQLQENDILISKDGTLGKIGYVKNLDGPCSVASGIFVLRNTKKDEVDFDYIYHVLKSSIFKDFIRRNKAQGSTIPHLYQRDLENFEIDLPDINEQRRIAGVLNIIDLKINNNNTINNQLESLAKTLYDYWFLQFEFPNEEGKPYKSAGGKMVYNEELKREIPEGWDVGKLGDLYKSQTGYAFKSSSWKKTGHPVLTIKAIDDNGNINIKEASHIDENYDTKLNKYAVENGNMIFAMSGNTIGKLGIVAFNVDNVLINQRVLILKTTAESIAYPYITIMNSSIQNSIRQLGANSAQPNISEEQLNNIKVLIPDIKILSVFNKNCKPLFAELIKSRKENQHLAELRDFLLPMLMNGQVTFKEEH